MERAPCSHALQSNESIDIKESRVTLARLLFWVAMRSFLNLFYRRTHANGLGMLSEPSGVLRVLKLTPTSHAGDRCAA